MRYIIHLLAWLIIRSTPPLRVERGWVIFFYYYL